MSGKGLIGRLKTIPPTKLAGILGGVAVSTAISAGADYLLQKGIKIPGLKWEKGPMGLMSVPVPGMVDLYPTQQNVITRSVMAGIIGSGTTGLLAGIVYFRFPQREDIAVGLGIGAGISLAGWIIKGLVQKGTSEIKKTLKIKGQGPIGIQEGNKIMFQSGIIKSFGEIVKAKYQTHYYYPQQSYLPPETAEEFLARTGRNPSQDNSPLIPIQMGNWGNLHA